jgi:hypothetical protein
MAFHALGGSSKRARSRITMHEEHLDGLKAFAGGEKTIKSAVEKIP